MVVAVLDTNDYQLVNQEAGCLTRCPVDQPAHDTALHGKTVSIGQEDRERSSKR